MSRNYAFRYLVEPWNKPQPYTGTLVMPQVRISENNYGFADTLFIASIVKDGSKQSVLLLDTETGHPSREMLLLVREHIDHYLEKHAE